MTAMLKALAWLVVAAGIAGCSGGDGGGGYDAAPRIEGLLLGTATRSSADRDVIVFASEGRFMAAEAGGYFFDGEYTLDESGGVSGTARIYGTSLGLDHARYFTQTATLTGTAGEDAWQVTITGASSTTSFALAHDAEDAQNSSLPAVEGTWVYDPDGSNTSTLTVASDGTTSSTNDAGCVSAGSLAPIDPDFNLYDSATTVTEDGTPTECPNAVEGGYTGLIARFDYLDAGSDQLVVMLAKSDFMFFYPYLRQP